MSESSRSSNRDEDEVPEDDSDSTLLYDILVYREWPPQPDSKLLLTSSEASQNGGEPVLPSSDGWKNRVFSWVKWTGSINPNCILPERVSLLFASRSPWKICLSDDGLLLAVLEDTFLEIYQRDHFQTPLSKIRINKDPLPAYRQLCWSPDGSLLAVTSSNGQIDIYDSYGFVVYSIFSQKLPARDASHSVQHSYAGVFFSDIRVKSRDWIFELILVDYSGKINSFLLSPSGYQEFTSFNLTSHGNLTAVSYSTQHGLLCIAGPAQPSESNGPSRHGLSMWRLLSEPPFYDFVPPYDQLSPGASPSRFFLATYLYSSAKSQKQDYVYLLEMSPNGKEICAVHASGAISVWQIPSMRPSVTLPLEDQPSYDDLNPSLLQNPKFKKRKKQFLKHELKWLPLSVKWWNDNSLVVVRFSGGVSIITIDKNRNLLGESSEFFSGAPALSHCFGGGFFVLECETAAARKSNDSTSELTDDNIDGSFTATATDEAGDNDLTSDDDDEDDLTVIERGKRMAASIAYTLTESERFAPPRKKPKMMVSTYKLLSLNSTTPEELYARKIEMEEYGEALILAQHYDLDSDQVYERQWKLSNLSVTAIKDYLTKIKRRSLVLRECTKTVPSDVDAVRELLQYGLKETDSDVISCEGDEMARFIAEKAVVPTPTYLSEEEIEKEKREKEELFLSRINWKNLSVYQRDILSQRRLLLRYLNRLDGFLSVLEEDAEYEKRRIDPYSNFDPILYIKFREQPILKSAIEFAREGKIGAVSSLLSRYPGELNQFVLGILGNIPESLSPIHYSHLVPFKPVNPPRNAISSNERDWSDFEFVRQTLVKDPALDDMDEIRRVVKSFPSKFVVDKNLPSSSLLSTWINDRAKNIYEESALVDHALALLNCAELNGVDIDVWLQHRLFIVETMMFSLHKNDQIISLKKLEGMSHLDVALKLMEGADETHFMNHFAKTLSPFLERLEVLEPGSRDNLLRNYLLHLSTTSLQLPTVFLKESFATDGSVPLNFSSNDECIAIGIDCIYVYEGEDDQDHLVTELAGFLRKKCLCPRMREELSDILDIMRSIKLCKKYTIPKSLQYFKSSRSNTKVMEELCVQITRRAEGKKPRLNAREWSEVLQDLFELRRLCPLILTEWYCIESLCNSLLCSENKDNIKLVQDIFAHSIADVLFKSSGKSSPMLYILSMYKVGPVPKNTQKRVVIKACQFYFDSCRDVDDANLEFVRACLNLVPDVEKNDPDIEPINNFLSALEMLSEFGVSILPIVLKNADNQKNVVRKILQVDPQAYKNVRKIIKLVKLLGSLRQGEKEEEALILSLVADFALKACDFEACLTICDILMSSHASSPAAVKVCSELVRNESYENIEAKARLSSFCVTYCSNETLEEMLGQRKRIHDQVCNIHKEEIVVPSPDFSLEDMTSQSVALVKAAAEQTSKALPESGTRAISSLWGKISQFTPVLQSVASELKGPTDSHEPEIPKMRSVVEEEMTRIPSRPQLQLVVDDFYENVHPGCRAGKLRAYFDSYASYRTDGTVDETTMKLLKKHYDNSFGQQVSEDDELDWSILKDLLVLIVSEDCSLGIAFILTEFSQREPVVAQEILEDPKMAPYVLYLASLQALVKRLGPKTFHVPPGLLYACAKSLNTKNCLNSELFESALTIAEVEFE